ncbi:MAG: peptidylprolyl isomerase [Bacteroidetes Order II. Incertae sedis bacterium]|nr:peptidylprolyl isomerase [Bacteroidetes Order II. bacterium]
MLFKKGLGLLGLMVLVQYAIAQPKPALAEVAGNIITASQFQTRYTDYLLKTGLKDDPRLRKAMLETMVSTEMIIRAAEERGISQTAGYKAWEQQVRRKLSIEAYTSRVMYRDIAPSEAELQELLLRAYTTMKASHLFARDKASADRLYARVQAGEEWNALAKEVFADTVLANRGGSLGAFGFEDMDPEFEKAAFRLKPGEVSKPVRTALGYSIIRLDEKFTKPIVTESEFLTRKDRLTQYFLIQKRREVRAQHTDQLASEIRPVWNQASLNRLVLQLDGGAIDPARRRELQALTQQPNWQKQPLVTFGRSGERRTWTVAQFRAVAEAFTSAKQRAVIQDKPALERFILGLLLQEEMVRRATNLKIHQLPEFEESVRMNMKDWVVREEMARIDQAIQIPADSMRAYFEQHRANMVSDEKVQVSEILVSTLDAARAIKRELTSENFAETAQRYSERLGGKDAKGDLGFVTQAELGGLAEAVWNAEKGTILGPLEVSGKYVLLKVGDKLPPLPMNFEQAEPYVRRLLWNTYSERVMARYRASLEAKYRDKINTNHTLLYDLSLYN